MPKPSKQWKEIERRVADALSPVFGTKLFRNPLSGANNRKDDGAPRRGDIVFPAGYRLIAEVKYRASIGFHRFFDQAVDDAIASNYPTENVILFSKEKGKRPILATIHLTLLLKLLETAKENGTFELIFGTDQEGTENKNKNGLKTRRGNKDSESDPLA